MPTCSKRSYASRITAIRAVIALRKTRYPRLAGIHWCAEHLAWHTTSKQTSGRIGKLNRV